MSRTKDLIKNTCINIGYLTMVFFIGVFLVYIITNILSYNLNSETGFIATVLIFTTYAVIEMSLLYFMKLTPAIIVLIILIAPVIMVYKLFRDSDLLVINPEVPSRVANCIFYKNLLDSYHHPK